ncbi:MAG: hypothetical protein ABI202_10320 [Candidatus Baltobacteraceae bacterium]
MAPSVAPDGAALLAKVINRNAKLGSYRSAVAIAFRERTFPFLGARLTGHVYFEAPDRCAVVFAHVPRVMSRFPHAFAGMLDVPSWPKEYAVRSDGRRSVGGRTDESLRLTPKDRAAEMDHAEAFVDPASLVIDEVDWTFRNGMEFDVTQRFSRLGSFLLLSTQHASIRVPFARVTSDATFSDYQTNVAIDKSVFAQN